MNNLKLFVGIIFLLLFSSNLYAKQDENHWLDEMITVKEVVQKQLEYNKMPFVSTLMKGGMPAEKISVDITGFEHLILVTDCGPNGNKLDHSVWANAKLYKKDGSFVWLDELEYLVGKAGWETPKKNTGAHGGKIKIANKTYDHGMFCYANGILKYALNKEYTRFESEVGIDDNARGGSVYFKVLNVDIYSECDKLINKSPNSISKFLTILGNFNNWMLSSGCNVEKAAAEKVLSMLKEKQYFQSQLNLVDRLTVDKDKRGAYIRIAAEMLDVKDMQDHLQWLNKESVRLAFEDMKKHKRYDANKYQQVYEDLIHILDKGFNGIYYRNQDAYKMAERALELHKSLMLSNPLLDVDKILAVSYELGTNSYNAMAPQLGTQSNNWSNQESARRGGFDAKIIELSNLRGNINLREIYSPDNGSSIADLRLHWNGDRMMFTQLQEDKRWNIFEVQVDGANYKKLIHNEEPDLEFYDGTYLPDGRILAISNIGYQGVPCVNGSDPVGNLVIYNPKNQNMRRLTFDQDANWNPVVMNNGRVMYTRWEYTDLTHYYSRIVMHMNPDGTENKALYGSGAMFPNSTFDIQPLPNHSSSFVGIISGHHGIARSGRMIVFDPTKGRKSVAGMVQEIPYRNRPIKEEIKDGLVNGVWPQFIKPTVINDKYYLVAAKLSQNSLWGIYLVDVFDNVTCVYESESEGFISPILLRKTATPPVIPDRIKLNEKEATFFIQDIYEGEGLRGIPRGTVKELRLHAYEYAYVKTASDHNWHGIQSGWDIKRMLGTVPVEEDGSVIFKAPANTPISIQPIDKDGVAVQWMRSWVTGQPGEIVSCIGCHEDQNQIAIPKRVIASQKSPHKLTPPEGGTRSFTFDLEIQPILDRACVACHNGNGKAFDLRGGTKDSKGYGTSYLNLHPFVHRQGGEGDMVVLQPYEYHPNTSELVRILKKGHYNVTLTDKEWRTIYNWIDYNAPDKGYFNANVLHTVPYKGFDQIARRKELADKYGNGAGVDWKKELSDYASLLKSKGEIVPELPQKQKPEKVKDVKVKSWPFSAGQAVMMQTNSGKSSKIIELSPNVKMKLVYIPAGQFAMGSNNGESDAKPVSKVKIEKGFWMGELEVTNEQYNVFFPEHDSRFIDQQWKDHVVQGYPANTPEQPVIRVSYEDAMNFCRKLSEHIGMSVTLPTEAQWEWACRAGSDSDFWYGDMHTNFASKDNLADKTTLKFAVYGVDPKPMTPDNFWYKYYTYLPKEESVDDGSLVQVGGKKYEANPFGLYCMHGNVSEWTRSDYVSYPYKDKQVKTSDLKVVRGGSFFERPKFSTSYARKAYYPYQRVFNVGFRIIIEDN